MSLYVNKNTGQVIDVSRFYVPNGFTEERAIYYDNNGNECEVHHSSIVPLSKCGKKHRDKYEGDFIPLEDVPGSSVRDPKPEPDFDVTDCGPVGGFLMAGLALICAGRKRKEMIRNSIAFKRMKK